MVFSDASALSLNHSSLFLSQTDPLVQTAFLESLEDSQREEANRNATGYEPQGNSPPIMECAVMVLALTQQRV